MGDESDSLDVTDINHIIDERNNVKFLATASSSARGSRQERLPLRTQVGASIAVIYVIFDLLHLDGEELTDAPYRERRAELEALDLNGAHWQTLRRSLTERRCP